MLHTETEHHVWCVEHVDDPTPADGWCRGKRTTVAGAEVQLVGRHDEQAKLGLRTLEEAPEVSMSAALQLLAELAGPAACTTFRTEIAACQVA